MDFYEFMFGGELVDGGLSNELWLHKNCPDEFKDLANKWTSYVYRNLQTSSRDIDCYWQWQEFSPNRLSNLAEREKRLNCFNLLRRASRTHLYEHERAAVCGWMLSNMVVSTI